jgi:hypothetical protein
MPCTQLQLSEATLNLKDFSSFADVDFTLLEAAQVSSRCFLPTHPTAQYVALHAQVLLISRAGANIYIFV